MGTARRAALFTLVLALGRTAHADDFDPAGRRHKKPAPAAGVAKPAPSKRPDAARAPAKPATRPTSSGPSSEALIARYTAVVLADPSNQAALTRLADLHRQRDGHAKALVAELERRVAAAGPDAHAARIALASLDARAGEVEKAIATLEAAAAERPSDATPLLVLGRLAQDRGEIAKARDAFARALALVPTSEREGTLRALVGLALDAKDVDDARRWSRELVAASGGSIFARGELGRELLARGDAEHAEPELRALVAASAGDNRTLAPALRDLARALVALGRHDDARGVLARALAAAGGASGVRGEILALVVDEHRASGDLDGLVRLLEREGAADPARLAVLGGLYEELGQPERALAAYRRAARGRAAIEVRVRVVRLLQASGEIDAAIREYEALVAAAPGQIDFAFELAEAHLARGDRARALATVARLEGSTDADVLSRVADFYERIDEKTRALALLSRLAAAGGDDPVFLVELGDRELERGDRKKALETWRRILTSVRPRGRALVRYGETLIAHDMPVEGLAALREAVESDPGDVAYRKAYATALERTATAAGMQLSAQARWDEAKRLWEGLLEGAGADRALAREARTHLVTVLTLSHRLEAERLKLAKRFEATPPDLEAGRVLADALARDRRLPEAAAVLERLSKLAPGDADVLATLERVQVLARDLPKAIATVERLVEADPSRARDAYQRMATYAAELYRDDDAIAYAARAVALSPDDAEGHHRLAGMYRKKGDVRRATTELRAALAKNDRLFGAYFELAELLVGAGEIDEAERLYRRVLRVAPDDDLVAEAARLAMQLDLGRGTTAGLERDLVSLSIAYPRRATLRRLLLELYGALAHPLVETADRGAGDAATTARAELERMGARALKPLLDALASDREAEQRIAIELLARVRKKGAGAALTAFAAGSADVALRVRALVAAGMLDDATLLPRFEALLRRAGRDADVAGDPLSLAAAWAAARTRDARATPLLLSLLGRAAPDVRALAALGLAATREPSAAAPLVRLAGDAAAGPLARAAAALALGDLRPRDARAALEPLARTTDPLVRANALLSLARLGAEGAEDALAEAFFAPEESVRAAAAAAATTKPSSAHVARELLEVDPGDGVDVASLLSVAIAPAADAAGRAAALVRLRDALARAARTSAGLSPERAAIAASALSRTSSGTAVFAPLSSGAGDVAPALAADAARAAEAIGAAIVPAFVALARHPSADVRVGAVAYLATRREDEAETVVARSVADGDAAVASRALAALGASSSPALVAAIVAKLGAGETLAIRVEAARALGRLDADAPRVEAVAALAKAARSDADAFVREAALDALAALDAARAREVATDAAARDPEPHVRGVAADLLRARPDR